MKVYTSQPQVIPTINWNNPLTRGISFVAIGGIPINLVNQKPGTLVGTVEMRGEERGRVFRTAAGANRVDFTDTVTSVHTESSFASIFISNANATTQYLILKDLTNPPVHLFWLPANDTLQLTFGNGGIFQSLETVSRNVWHIASASSPYSGDLAAASVRAYLDGIRLSNGLNTNAASYSSSSTSVSLSGRSLDNLRQLIGAQALSIFWTRTLSDEEHKEFYKNPWAIFQAPNRFSSLFLQSGNTAFSPRAPYMTGVLSIKA